MSLLHKEKALDTVNYSGIFPWMRVSGIGIS